jgi:hypothetical protein
MALAGNIDAGTPDEVEMTCVHSYRAAFLANSVATLLQTTLQRLDLKSGHVAR